MKKNVDQQEIEKFSAHATSWWDPQGDMKPLHMINPLRMKFITDQVDLKNKKVLDVGCGGGILTESLAQAGAVTSGLDLAEDSILVAKQHAKDNNLAIDYINQSVEELADSQSEQFDVICCMEMLEHVPDPSSIITSCSKLLKPGGHAFFSTLNRNTKSYLFAILGAEYILGILPKGTHNYSKFIKPSELEAWCRDAQLQWQQTAGLGYNPLSGNYSLSRDIDVNYLAYCQKIV